MKRGVLSLLAITVLLLHGSFAEAGFVKSYDFNGNLSDTLGNGLNLTASGGTISGGRYHFDRNEGLTMNSAVLDTENYAIEFSVRFDQEIVGYNKLVDFQGLTTDHGLYAYEGALTFYPEPLAGGSLVAGNDYIIGLERSSGVVRVFLEGNELFSFNDSFSLAVPGSNILNFFIDDAFTSGLESFAGSVDFIRIHEDASTFGRSPAAVPEPFSAAVWGAGVVAAVIARRRNQTKK